jgi:hypothetical protein
VPRLRVSPRAVIAGVLLAATGAAATASILAGPAGLTASVFVAAGPRGSAVHAELDRGPSPESVERLGVFTGENAPRITWDGFLYCETSREYELGLFTNGPARVFLDGRVVLESPQGIDLSPEKISIERGQHLFSIEYEQRSRRPALAIKWDVDSPYTLHDIPAAVYSPVSLPEWRWRLRGYTVTLMGIASSLWSALFVWLGWRAVRRVLPDRGALPESAPVTLVLTVFAVLFGIGIGWGWPATWAPDELDPPAILNAIGHRFSDGWFDKYPPLHYYLLGVVYSPVLMAGELGWLHVDSEPVRGLLYLQGRVLTLAMAIGTLTAVALLATRTLGSRYAWPAALCAGAFLPFVFYAKTMNVDVPYVFWFVISCLFLVEALRDGRARDCIGFGIAAAAAVGTKDQAYALYILPALYLAWRLGRSRQGAAALAVGTVAGLVTLILIFNLPFNYEGFREHVDLVLGPASEGYRMFPPTAAGQWVLATVTAGQLLWTLGVPGTILVVAGLVRRGRAGGDPAVPIWVFLVAVSYYVTLIAMIGYVYDRFLLPVTTVLALAAAIGMRRLAEGEKTSGFVSFVLRRNETRGLLIAWLLWRVASVDALLVRDSRYAAEAWLRANVTRHAWVVTVDEFGYLPRLDRFRHKQIQATIEDTLSNNPEFIVVNTEFLARSPAGSPEREWLEWLQGGAGPYAVASRHKSPLGWSAFAWQTRFTDRREDDFTNVDKANPEILIFRRRPEKAGRSAPGDSAFALE